MRLWQALAAALAAFGTASEVCPSAEVNLLQTDLRLSAPAEKAVKASRPAYAQPEKLETADDGQAGREASGTAAKALVALQETDQSVQTKAKSEAKSEAKSSTRAIEISVGTLCAVILLVAVLICGLAVFLGKGGESPATGSGSSTSMGRDLSRMAKLLPGPPQQGLVPASAASLPRVSMVPYRSQHSTQALQPPSRPPSAAAIYSRPMERPSTTLLPPTSAPAPPGGELAGPPAICPSLILPRDEARFMVVMASLQQRGIGPIDIYGTSGRKLMHAVVGEQNSGLRVFSVASVGCEHDPRCSIRATAPQDRMASLEVYGRNEQPYGALEPAHAGAVLQCGGQKVMTIEVEDGISFRMVALSTTGTVLATAGPNVAGLGQKMMQETVWRIEVKPRVDAVLVVSCMLSMILLWPRMLAQNPGSSASFARGG